MNRDYSTGEFSDVKFFTGFEVEKTPAYGMKTLFVVGTHPVVTIHDWVRTHDIKHIFFGANHSFNISQDIALWENMIVYFLKKDYWCSLDIPLECVETFNDLVLNEYDQFIPQIRVPVPYIKLWNYNTMLKIDDVDFKASNPGVWCHSLHDLTNRSYFTPWDQYTNDVIIK